MSQEVNPFRKIAVLTTLTMLIGSAEISSAATLTETQSFALAGPNSVTVTPLTFNQFAPSNGTLTQAAISFTSQILETGGPLIGGVTNIVAQLQVVTTPNVTFTDTIPISDGSTKNFSGSRTHTGSSLAQFIGVGTIGIASLSYTASCEANLDFPFYCGPGWSGDITLTYTYDPAVVAAVPLPAALPLFATGLGALGLLGWRRKRRQVA